MKYLVVIAAILLGMELEHRIILNRAKKIEKEVYTNQDLEIIIFNEVQL